MSIQVDIAIKRVKSAYGNRNEEHDNETAKKQPQVRSDLIHIPGDTIMDNAEGWMDGHGSYCSVLPDKRVQMIASVAGIRQVFTRVVVVNPLKSRYAGEIGDIVVGRILQVGRKAWTVDVGAQRHAVLSLGAINLPSGELRRKTEEDIGFMRGYLREGDLVSAEVQKTGSDGQLLLHTRSTRYGRLVHGMLLHVHPELTKRGRAHFISYETFGVHLIIGVNGAIWIAPTQRQLNVPLGLDQGEQMRKRAVEDIPNEEELFIPMADEEAEKVGASKDPGGFIISTKQISPIANLEVRKCMARMRNCIGILNSHQTPINRESIRIMYDASVKYEPKDLLKAGVTRDVFESARHEFPDVNTSH